MVAGRKKHGCARFVAAEKLKALISELLKKTLSTKLWWYNQLDTFGQANQTFGSINRSTVNQFFNENCLVRTTRPFSRVLHWYTREVKYRQSLEQHAAVTDFNHYHCEIKTASRSTASSADLSNSFLPQVKLRSQPRSSYMFPQPAAGSLWSASA